MCERASYDWLRQVFTSVVARRARLRVSKRVSRYVVQAELTGNND